MKIAIVGYRGLVGSELIKLLDNKKYPLICIDRHHLQSKTSALEVFKETNFVFFATPEEVAKKWIPLIEKENIISIDLSSAFRNNVEVPLIIPEINGHLLLRQHKIIASPNCTTTLMLMAIFPLYQLAKIRQVIVTTFQAASGGGKSLFDKLGKDPLSFPIHLHDSFYDEEGYNEEERKMQKETRKILADRNIHIAPTCVRVPSMRCHSLALRIQFYDPPSLLELKECLQNDSHIKFIENFSTGLFPDTNLAKEKNQVYCGRLRQDSLTKEFELWVVGDQLLKGAAYNGWQIFQQITSQKTGVFS